MNAPIDHATFGSLEKLREEVMEQLHLCSWHSSIAVDQGAMRADAGMTYNTRRAVAHLRMAMDVLKMMHEHRQNALARTAEAEGAAAALGMEKPRVRP